MSDLQELAGSHTPSFGSRKVKLRGKRLTSLTPCNGTSASLHQTSDSDVPRYQTSKFAPAPVKTHRAGI